MTHYRNHRAEKERTKIDTTSAAGPNPYNPAARPTLTFLNLREIESIEDVKMAVNSGIWVPKPISVAGNVLTYAVIVGAAGADLELGAVNISGVTFCATARGR